MRTAGLLLSMLVGAFVVVAGIRVFAPREAAENVQGRGALT